MKYCETHFEEYITENNRENMHPKLEKLYNKFPKDISDLRNLIFFGPSGVGKYTQVLSAIKKYSPTELKYEKKMIINYNKQQYFFKISDIHYEVDMSLLGCNSKILWNETYQNIIDSISAKTNKSGIIVCKHFHEIHNELLDIFYSYMQHNNFTSVDLKFIIITEELSFIPDNILNCCEIINISRPRKTKYSKCIKNKLPNNLNLEQITNIKMLRSYYNDNLMENHKIICNKIINCIIKIENIQFLKLRDLLYDILIYNLNITSCVWYIISSLIIKNKIKKEQLSLIMIKTYRFFQYYNNNYRPIYHLEKYLLTLSQIINEF